MKWKLGMLLGAAWLCVGGCGLMILDDVALPADTDMAPRDLAAPMGGDGGAPDLSPRDMAAPVEPLDLGVDDLAGATIDLAPLADLTRTDDALVACTRAVTRWPVGQSANLHLAVAQGEEALAWAQIGPHLLDDWSIRLQRLSPAGQTVGMPVELAVIQGPGKNQPPPVSVASDGSSYLACWGYTTPRDGDLFDCAVVPVGGGPPKASALRRIRGERFGPESSFGPAGYVVAYGGNQIKAQRLAADGALVGNPVMLAGGLPVPTKGGYHHWSANGIQPLDANLAPVGMAQPFPHDIYWYTQLVPVGGQSAVLYDQQPMQFGDTFLRVAFLDANGKAGPEVHVDDNWPALAAYFHAVGYPDGLALLWSEGPQIGNESPIYLHDISLQGVVRRTALPIALSMPECDLCYTPLIFAAASVPPGLLLAVTRIGPPNAEIEILRADCVGP